MVSDTSDLVRASHRMLVADLSPAERLRRAFALSAFVRRMAWAGAERAVGEGGPDAVRARFLTQLYGRDMTDALRALLARL